MTLLSGWKKIKRDYILDFMNTKEYIGMPFVDLVKKFNLSKDELLDLVQTHTGDAPLEIFHWNDEEIAIG